MGWDKRIRVLRQSEIPLRGWHNVENVLAALRHQPGSRITDQSHAGCNHRISPVYLTGWNGCISWKGADWYNDSIATAPERVMAAIHSFDSPADIHRTIVLLAGGRDKNLPWNELADLIHARVDHLILFGEAAGKIACCGW